MLRSSRQRGVANDGTEDTSLIQKNADFFLAIRVKTGCNGCWDSHVFEVMRASDVADNEVHYRTGVKTAIARAAVCVCRLPFVVASSIAETG